MKEKFADIIDQFKNYKVLVVGDAILDTYIKGTSDRLCREAPVPVINVKEEEHDCGGAANTAINVASLGAETYFLSVIGKDDSGKELLNVLKKHKVNTECIISDRNRRTLSKKRVTASSNILLRIDDGSTMQIQKSTEKEVLEKIKRAYKKVNAIILSDYGYGVISDDVIKVLIELKEANPKPIIVDSKNLARFKKLAPSAVKPNYEEALKLLSLNKQEGYNRIRQISESGKDLLKITGADCVAATLDADGTLVFQNGKDVHRIFTSPQDNKRAIGAGDTFISALCLAFCSGLEGSVASEIASAASAIVLQKEGTVVCTCAELKAFFNENPKYISSKYDLANTVRELKNEGKKIVFTNGCFDILHRGHVNLLAQAKAKGDVLIVGINADESIKRLKGPDRPVNSLEDRIMVLAGLQSVDFLISFKEDSPEELIKAFKPDIFVKGGDYSEESIPESRLVKQLGGKVEIIPFVDNRSTTLIIEKIKESSGNGNNNLSNYNYAKASGME